MTDKVTKRSVMGNRRRQRDADNYYANKQRPQQKSVSTLCVCGVAALCPRGHAGCLMKEAGGEGGA